MSENNTTIEILDKKSKSNYENRTFDFSKNKGSGLLKNRTLGREDLLKYIKEERVNITSTEDLKNIINGSKNALGEGGEFVDFMAEVLDEYLIIDKKKYDEKAKDRITQIFAQTLNEETLNSIIVKRLSKDRERAIKKTGISKGTLEKDLEEMANKAREERDKILQERNKNTAAETSLAIKTIDKSLNTEQQQIHGI